MGSDVYDKLVKTDAFGRRVPTQFSGFELLGVALQSGVRHARVPRNHWKQRRVDEIDHALVKCACGAETLVALAATARKCQCERWFFFDGTGVWSLNGPGPPVGGVH